MLFRSVWKSLRNLGERVQVILPEELNAYDILVNDYIVFSQATLTSATARLNGGGRSAESIAVISDSGEEA